MENWEGWQTLLTVVEAGTLSAAATQLRVDATTIGRRLGRLEAKLGPRLLVATALGYGAYNYKTIQNILERELDLSDAPDETDQLQMPFHDNIRGENYYQ